MIVHKKDRSRRVGLGSNSGRLPLSLSNADSVVKETWEPFKIESTGGRVATECHIILRAPFIEWLKDLGSGNEKAPPPSAPGVLGAPHWRLFRRPVRPSICLKQFLREPKQIPRAQKRKFVLACWCRRTRNLF